MFAVIKTGGKQYRVAKDDVIRVEKLPAAPGDEIELGDVLMLGEGAETDVGAPLIEGARVAATVLEQAREAKILVFKKKRRKKYRRTMGHRQEVTVLRIDDILRAGETRKAAAKQAAKPEDAPAAAPATTDDAKAATAKTAKKAAAKKAPAKKAAAKKAPAKKAAAKKAPAKKAASKGPDATDS